MYCPLNPHLRLNPMSYPFFNASPLLLSALVFSLGNVASPAWAGSLQERQSKVLKVVEKVSPAVVGITGSTRQGMMGSGSGVIISKDGLVLTAGHVLAATGAELLITLPGGREVKGKALGRNMNRDAALARITEPGDYPFVEMAPGDSAEAGEWVLALGHPGGYDPQRTAPLRVGRLWETDTKTYFRSDCTVSGGDSGGPLFDLEGRVIGIHSSISQNLSENRHVPIGVFADDMDRLKEGDVWGRLSSLMPGMREPRETEEAKPRPRANESQRPPRNTPRLEPAPPPAPTKGNVYLGVQLDPAPDGTGAVVVEVADGSPAARAGLKLEDVILKVGNESVKETSDVVTKVRAAKPGDKLKITIRRAGAEKELEVTLGTID